METRKTPDKTMGVVLQKMGMSYAKNLFRMQNNLSPPHQKFKDSPLSPCFPSPTTMARQLNNTATLTSPLQILPPEPWRCHHQWCQEGNRWRNCSWHTPACRRWCSSWFQECPGVTSRAVNHLLTPDHFFLLTSFPPKLLSTASFDEHWRDYTKHHLDRY